MLRGRTIISCLASYPVHPHLGLQKYDLFAYFPIDPNLTEAFSVLASSTLLNDIYQFQVPGFHKWGDRISSCLLVQKKTPLTKKTTHLPFLTVCSHRALYTGSCWYNCPSYMSGSSAQSLRKVILKKCPNSHSGVELNISECPHILCMWSSKFQNVRRLRSQYEELKISKCPHILVYICGAHTQAVPKQKTPFVLFHSSLTSALASTGCYKLSLTGRCPWTDQPILLNVLIIISSQINLW